MHPYKYPFSSVHSPSFLPSPLLITMASGKVLLLLLLPALASAVPQLSKNKKKLLDVSDEESGPLCFGDDLKERSEQREDKTIKEQILVGRLAWRA